MILELKPESVVPGHGPITDARGVNAVKEYLTYIHHEAKQRYDSGMDAMEACRDIMHVARGFKNLRWQAQLCIVQTLRR